MSDLKQGKKRLALCGDGRSDSPGHCAKFGLYTVIEMSCKKVLDYKLVQVESDSKLPIVDSINLFVQIFANSINDLFNGPS